MNSRIEVQDKERSEFQPATKQRSDYELVTAFVENRDEEAFRAIVLRYGSLVMGVCCGVLRNEHDAEDACQATFIVLAKNAKKIRRKTSLASWLYGVAYRNCLKASARIQKQKRSQLMDAALIEDESLNEVADCHATRIMHEEINRLPEQYRAPLLLCCLEGMSREQAAEQLGCSLGAIKGRIERARQKLRVRLLTRGVTVNILIGFVVDRTIAQASISDIFVTSTVDAALAFPSESAVEAGTTSDPLVPKEGNLSMTSYASKECVLASAVAASILFVVCGLSLSHRVLGQAPANDLKIVESTPKPPVREATAQFGVADATVNTIKSQEKESASGKDPSPAAVVLKKLGEATSTLNLARLSKLFLPPDKTTKGRQRALHLEEAKKDWERAKNEPGSGKRKVSFANTVLIVRTDMQMEGSTEPMHLELEITRTADGWKVASFGNVGDSGVAKD